MRWPPWSTESDKESGGKKKPISWTDNLNATDWSHYTDPRTLIPTILLTTTILASARLYRTYLRRIPGAPYVKPAYFRKRSLFGTVTRVGDADGFRLEVKFPDLTFHTPGGRLMGWGWLPWRKIPVKVSELKNKTIAIRLAGIDAPEGAHFGKTAQPYSAEGLNWLRNYILNRRVRAYIYKQDQYSRIVATVFVRRFLFRKDVGKEMLKRGLATIYEAKMGAEFGDFEEEYRKAEQVAKRKKLGMWSGKMKDYESPMDYKKRTSTPNEPKQ